MRLELSVHGDPFVYPAMLEQALAIAEARKPTPWGFVAREMSDVFRYLTQASPESALLAQAVMSAYPYRCAFAQEQLNQPFEAPWDSQEVQRAIAKCLAETVSAEQSDIAVYVGFARDPKNLRLSFPEEPPSEPAPNGECGNMWRVRMYMRSKPDGFTRLALRDIPRFAKDALEQAGIIAPRRRVPRVRL